MVQAEFGEHLLHAPILIFQHLQAFYVRGFHAALLEFPVVIGRIGDTVFTADLFDQAATFNSLQDLNDLSFCIA